MKMPKQKYTAGFRELAVKRVKEGQAVGTVAKEAWAGPWPSTSGAEPSAPWPWIVGTPTGKRWNLRVT